MEGLVCLSVGVCLSECRFVLLQVFVLVEVIVCFGVCMLVFVCFHGWVFACWYLFVFMVVCLHVGVCLFECRFFCMNVVCVSLPWPLVSG